MSKPSEARIYLNCGHCYRSFDVPTSMNGGQASCPTCNKLVDVPAGAEPLFSALVVGGVLTVLVATAYTLANHGWGVGLGVFAAGAAVIVLSLLMA